MLTKADIQAIGKLLDNKLKNLQTDVAAIETRISDLEIGRVTKLDFLEIRTLLNKVEKRMAVYETRLVKIESSMATKADLKNSLHRLENRLQKSINRLADSADNRLLEVEEKVEKLNQQIDHPPIATS